MLIMMIFVLANVGRFKVGWCENSLGVPSDTSQSIRIYGANAPDSARPLYNYMVPNGSKPERKTGQTK